MPPYAPHCVLTPLTCSPVVFTTEQTTIDGWVHDLGVDAKRLLLIMSH